MGVWTLQTIYIPGNGVLCCHVSDVFLAVVWGILYCCYYKDFVMQTTGVGVGVYACGIGGAVHVCILESKCTDRCKCVLVPVV